MMRLTPDRDALDRVLMTAFRKEAEYIKERRAEAIQRMGERWILANKAGRVAQ